MSLIVGWAAVCLAITGGCCLAMCSLAAGVAEYVPTLLAERWLLLAELVAGGSVIVSSTWATIYGSRV